LKAKRFERYDDFFASFFSKKNEEKNNASASKKRKVEKIFYQSKRFRIKSGMTSI